MSTIKIKGTSSGEVTLAADASSTKISVDKNVDITGKVITSAQSMVEAVSDASAVTVNSTTATTLEVYHLRQQENLYYLQLVVMTTLVKMVVGFIIDFTEIQLK